MRSVIWGIAWALVTLICWVAFMDWVLRGAL